MKWFCLINATLFLIFAGIDRYQFDLFGMIWNLAMSVSQLIGIATYQVIDEIKKRKEE